MSLRFVAVLVSCVSMAGAATAQTDGAYDSLSANEQIFVDALFEAQQPTGPDKSALTRDDIAARRGDVGWGKLFNDMKDEGLYPENIRNLGDVISAYRHEQNDIRRQTIETERADRKALLPQAGVDRFVRPERIERPDRPERPERPDRGR